MNNLMLVQQTGTGFFANSKYFMRSMTTIVNDGFGTEWFIVSFIFNQPISEKIIQFEMNSCTFRFSFPDESVKGCKSHYATKASCGKEVFITSWSFNVHKIKEKCPINCDQISKCCDHEHGDIIALVKAFKERANYLIHNVDHSNLVRYLDVSCTESNEIITIHVVQDYVKGAKSVRNLSANGILPDLPPIAEWLIKVISYLEKMKPKIHHGYINDGSIFVDCSGIYRFGDYHLIPYLMYLKGQRHFCEIDDVKALGLFLDHKNKSFQHVSKDFIEKCCSNETKWKCQELLAHEFLSNVHIGEATSTYIGPLLNQFEFIESLGQGSDGCVIKVRQPATDEYFALKIIKIPIGSKGKYTKVKRETQLIPKVKHKHVVEYLANWEQTIDASELGISFDDDEENQSGSESSSSASASVSIE